MSPQTKSTPAPYNPKTWETVGCPVCASTRSSPYETFGDRDQYHYVLCRDCRLVYLSPRPAYDDVFVADAYEHYADNAHAFQLDEAGNLVNYRWQRHPDDEVLEILELDQKHSALLDVGCAMGAFLASAQPHFDRVYGLEVSHAMASAVEKRLGVTVFTQKFEELRTDVRFSTILMSHVIEHIPDPHRWLQVAKGLLAPDGLLVICVPNMFSLNRRMKLFFQKLGLRRRSHWDAWRTPDHLYEPTIPAFRRLFEMNGYTVLDYYTYSRSEPVPKSWWGRLYNRRLRLGTNLRYYLRVKA